MNREQLEQPFPQNLIKKRRGQNGKQISYVEGVEFVKRLNQAFESRWSFEVVEHKILTNEVVVLGKLSADGVVKMAFGGSVITVSKDTGEVVSIADDLKAAATDSLKKSASLLGVGLHLYASGAGAEKNGFPANTDRLTDKQLAAIWSMAGELGLSEDDTRIRIAQAFNCGVEQMTKKEASSLIGELGQELRGAA